jgi:uncharacterized repeat protein (TIGR02543 family)
VPINKGKKEEFMKKRRILKKGIQTIILTIIMVLGAVLLPFSRSSVRAEDEEFLPFVIGSDEAFVISFDANGGFGTMDGSTVYCSSKKVVLPDCLFTPPDGMEFDAWAREENVVQDETVTRQWIRYMPGDQAVLSMTGNNTFKALWKDAATVYTVTFYRDSSKTDIYATKKVAEGRSISSLESPSRTGYAFSGWKMENGNAFTFDYIPNEDINVYAEWTRTNPTVSFDANGGSGKMDTVAVDGSAGNYVYTVPECDFVAPSGKVFSHWQEIDDETKVYHPGSAVKDKIIISDVESNISLKAVWISACTATIEADDIGSENVIVTWTYSNQSLNDTLSGTGLSYPVGANLCVAVNVPTETYTVSGSDGVTFSSGENGWTTNNVSTDIVITVSIDEGAVIYLDADGSCKVCTSATAVTGTEQEWGTEGNDTWYVVKSGITMNNRVEVRGNIHLILCDGATLSSEEGIAVNAGNSLTIYAQSMGNSKGKISIVSDQTSFKYDWKCYAAIGAGPNNKDAGDITINGGDIQVLTRSKSNTVAVIGGCSGYGFGNITINGGKVVAESDGGGAAVIGGGYQSKSGTIVINGGYVEARGTGTMSTGIGTGRNSNEGVNISITGGTVRAYGGTGIGGYDAREIHITISGGDIEAIANDDATKTGEGIGGYMITQQSQIESTIIITGGKVKAVGGATSGGAGIGCAYNSASVGEITISGGEVTTIGGSNSAGIGFTTKSREGNNNGLTAGTITITGGTVKASGGSSGIGIGKTNVRIPAVIFSYGDDKNVSIYASSYTGEITLQKEFMYQDSQTVATLPLVADRTIVPLTTYSVTFNPNGGIGTIVAEDVTIGETYTLPDCTFTAPEGKVFKEWSVVIGNADAVAKNPGEEIEVTAETTVTAVWEDDTHIGKISSAKVYLQNDISVVMYATFTDEPTSASMVVTLNGKETNLTGVRQEEKKYAFTFDGICPEHIGDSFTAVMTYVVNGETYTDILENYSVKKYCMTILEMSDTDLQKLIPASATLEETRCMAVDVLYYGAEAQNYMNHNTGNLATSNLTSAQAALATTYVTPTSEEGVVTTMLSGTKDDNYYWYSAKANLDNAATLQFYFMAPNGIEGLTVEIGGVEYTIHSTSTSGKYYVEITQMSAGDFRKVLTAKFKLNGTETGQAFSYSMNTYVSQVENHATFGSLAQRLYNYGKSAYNYAN